MTVFPSSVKAVVRGDPVNMHIPSSVSSQAGNHEDVPHFDLRGSVGEPSFGPGPNYTTVTTPYPRGNTTSATVFHQPQPLQRASSSSPLPQGLHRQPSTFLTTTNTQGQNLSRSGNSSTGRLLPAAEGDKDRESTKEEQKIREEHQKQAEAEWLVKVQTLQAELAKERLAREEAEERLARERRLAKEKEEQEARDRQTQEQKESERKERESRMIKEWESMKTKTEETQRNLEKEVLELKNMKDLLEKEIRAAEERVNAVKAGERTIKERIDRLEDELQEKRLAGQNEHRNRVQEMDREYAERRKVAESEFSEFRKRQEQALQDEIGIRRAAIEKEEAEFQKRKDKWQEDWNRVIEEAANIEREAKKAREEEVKRFLEEQRQARENWENQEKEWNRKKLDWLDKETEWLAKQKQNQRLDEEWIAMDKRRKELLEIEQRRQQEELQEQLKLKKLLKSTKPSQVRPDRQTKQKPVHSDFGPLNSNSASTADTHISGFSASNTTKAASTASACGVSWMPRATTSTGFDMGQNPSNLKKEVQTSGNAKKKPTVSKGEADKPSNTIPAQPVPLSAKLDRVSALAGIGHQGNWAASTLQGFNNLAAHLAQGQPETPLDTSGAPLTNIAAPISQPKSILRNPQAVQTPAHQSPPQSRKKFTPTPSELVRTLLSQNQSRMKGRVAAGVGSVGNLGVGTTQQAHGKGLSTSAARIRTQPQSEQRPKAMAGRDGLFAAGLGTDLDERDWKREKIRSRSGGRTGDRNSKSLRTLTREAEVEAQFFEGRLGAAASGGVRTSLDHAEEARLRAELFGTGRERLKFSTVGLQANKCCDGGLCSHAFVYPGPFLNKNNSALSTLESGALQRELIRESRCLDHT